MEQLTFLDKFIKVFGFKHIADYDTRVAVSDLKKSESTLLPLVNNYIQEIWQYNLFKKTPFNLARKSYQVDSAELALAVLKKCLQQANIPYETQHTKHGNQLRLLSESNLLNEYINKMNYLEKSELETHPTDAELVTQARDVLSYNLVHAQDDHELNTVINSVAKLKTILPLSRSELLNLADLVGAEPLQRKIVLCVFKNFPNFGKVSTCELNPDGFGLGKVALIVHLPPVPDGFTWKKDIKYNLVRTAALEIGDMRIDRTAPLAVLFKQLIVGHDLDLT